MNHRHTIAAVSLAVALSACSGSVVGSTFADEAALTAAIGDVVVVGRFDLDFPVTVTQVEVAQGGITFRHRGQPHDYSNWNDWEMRAVHVTGRSKDGVLVLRSKQKLPPSDPSASPPR